MIILGILLLFVYVPCFFIGIVRAWREVTENERLQKEWELRKKKEREYVTKTNS